MSDSTAPTAAPGIALSDLLAPHVAAPPGGRAGTCYVCGTATAHGYAEPPSDNFTAWASLYAGDVLCPVCRALLHDRRFRAASWLATPEGVRFTAPGDRAWLWPALHDPPAGPHAWYLTRGAQKQGWVTLARYVSQGPARLWVGTDWTDRPVALEAAYVAAQAPLLQTLRGAGLSKAALRSGQYAMKAWERAWAGGYAEMLEAARRQAGDPRWEVVVDAHP